jgi:hypothetical protein
MRRSGLVSSVLGYGQLDVSFEQGIEVSGSISCGAFIGWLSKYQLLKEDSMKLRYS